MREELLAHLTRLFEEELARRRRRRVGHGRGDPPFRRCGDAHARVASGRSLARTLGVFQLPFAGRFARRARRIASRYLLRINCWGVAVGIAAYDVAGLGRSRSLPSRRPHRGRPSNARPGVIFLMCFAGIQVATMFGWGLLSEGDSARTGAPCEPRRPPSSGEKRFWRIVGYAAAGSACWVPPPPG